MAVNPASRMANTALAARRVLIEVVHLLGQYRRDMVLVGGSVPQLLVGADAEPYIGTIDVDLALNHQTMAQPRYDEIRSLLRRHGYQPSEFPFRFQRTLVVHERTYHVPVDFLASEYAAEEPRRGQHQVQSIHAICAIGVAGAFEDYLELTLRGELPDGGQDAVQVRVAGVAPFLVMKAHALAGRIKPKDAWDIVYMLRNFPGGVAAIVKAFAPHVLRARTQEAAVILAQKFEHPRAVGPQWVGVVEEESDPDRLMQVRREAVERVGDLVHALRQTYPEHLR
jgi:hypothetical protein